MRASRKRRLARFASKLLVNRLAKAAVQLGVAPNYAVLETVGRRSGRRRRTPLGNGLAGNTFWIVAAHGRRSDYVRNLEANSRVRVCVGGRWRTGTARLVPDDDPRRRLETIGSALSRATVRALATEPLTIRVELD